MFSVLKAINCTFWAFVGTFGNVLIIGTITTTKSLRTTGNMLLLNLAFTDIWVSGLTGPLNLVGIIREKKLFEDSFVACNILATICITTCMCSVLTIASISMNRFFFICCRNWYDRMYTRKTMFFWCFATWAVGFLTDLPNHIPSVARHAFDPKFDLCLWDRDYNGRVAQVYGILALCAVFFALIWYIKIFLYVYRKTNFSSGSTRKQRVRQQNISLAKTLFIIFIVYIVCWAPVGLTFTIDVSNDWSSIWYGICEQLAHTNSSLNFFIYGLTNKQMRSGFVLFLTKKIPCTRKYLGRFVADNTTNLSNSRSKDPMIVHYKNRRVQLQIETQSLTTQ